MRWAVIALVFASTGCDSAPEICKRAKAKFFECSESAASTMFDKVYETCVTGARHADRGGDALAIKRVFEDCATATTCADFGACFEGHGWQFVLTSPTATTLELMMPPPSTATPGE